MKLLKSFYYAFCGVLHCIRYETNFRIHLVAMLTVIVFSNVYGVYSYEKAILVILISLVMVGELLNTAVEAVVDLLSPKKTKEGKIAKDAAAGAVLIFAAGAVVCAFFIFSDLKKWAENIIPFLKQNWIFAVIYIVCAWLFVFKCGTKKQMKTREDN